METLEIDCPVHHVRETIPVPAAREVQCGASENPADLYIEVVMEGGEPKIRRLFTLPLREEVLEELGR